jgi:REP element-mobilizing transposase RayT
MDHLRPAWARETDPVFLTICCRRRHANQLANEQIWKTLLQAADEMRDAGRWSPRLLVAMPDHVHVIADIPRRTGICSAVRIFKSKSAMYGHIEWQRDVFDHRIRNETAVRSKWHYVQMNPVRAGLCEKPDDWPYRKAWPRNRSPQGEQR